MRYPVGAVWFATGLVAGCYLLLPDRATSRTVLPIVAITAATLLVARRIRLTPAGRRLPWIALALGLLCFAVSDLMVVSWPSLTGSPHPWPGPAHLPFQFGLVGMSLGTIAFVRVRQRPDGASLLDAMIVGTSLGVVSWVLVVTPLLEGGLAEGRLATILLVSHPALHLVLLVAVLRLSTTTSRRSPAGLALLAALVTLIATSVGMGLLALADRYEPEGPLTIGWLLAAGGLAAAATHGRADELTISEPDAVPRAPTRRIIAHAVAALTLPGLMLLRAEGLADTLVAAATAGVLTLVTVRVHHLLVELERSQATEIADQRERSRRQFEALVRHAADVLIVLDRTGHVAYASPSAATMFGRDLAGDAIADLEALVHPDERASTLAALTERLAAKDGRPIRLRARCLDRGDRELHTEIVAVDLLDDADVAGVVLTLHDTTERAELESELRRLAFHDSLTGLPNRVLFQDRLVQALARADRSGRRVAVLLCDLDDFKDVNDTMGHPAGDQLLCELAGRFASSVRVTDTVARIGGDEFAVLCEDLGRTQDACYTAQRLLAATEVPIRVEGRELRVGISVGIAVDTGRRSAEEMLRDADVALYEAKGRGKNRWAVHQATMTVQAQARLQLGADLAEAVADGSLTAVYQPIHELEGGEVVGVEALARWNHPERGTIPPDEFIGIAEHRGLIVDLGEQVLDAALCSLRTWMDRCPERVMRMGVNLSPRQLLDPSLTGRVRAGVERYAVPADRIVFELTESVMLEEPDQALHVMHGLRELGVRFAIDDFGTGYSSLSYLRQLPIDIVKIDRSFVQELTLDRGTHKLVRSIVDLATGMGLDVVAEGVESHQQRELVRDMGCTFAQGFLFGGAVTREQFLASIGATDAATPAPEAGRQPVPTGSAPVE